MNLFSRHKNAIVLATVLLVQMLALAVQVKRQTDHGPVRLIRIVAIGAITPIERGMIHGGEGLRGLWANYIDLRHVRADNLRLKHEMEEMRLEREREQEDARQARRIQALLEFKENWIDKTVAAQVIGTSGTESSRLLYLDKGAADGIRPDMPVITPDGVAGKILAVFGDHVSQVLLISDPTSGLGATLVKSRLQGIVKGTPTGEVELNYIMGDENVQSGEQLVTSGGDRVFPRGLPIGTISKVSVGRNLFLKLQVKPAAQLDRLEEVLVVTQQKERAPDVAGLGPIRASDILSQHLPGVPQQPVPTPQTGAPQTQAAPNAAQPPAQPSQKPATPAPGVTQKPAQQGNVLKPQGNVQGTVQKPASTQPNRPAPGAAAKPVQPKPVLPKPQSAPNAAPQPGGTQTTGGGPR
jgi:rod shape-determining protein MreC